MVRFVVDDKAHANSKIRSVLADDPAALALWTVAGSWCGDQTNDGFVPDHQLPWLVPVGGEELARKLVKHGLWRRVRGGYQFHEWSADGDGTRRNLTREEVLANRQKKADAGRKGGLASGKTRSKDEAGALADASARAKALVSPNTSTNTSTKEVPSSAVADGFDEFWSAYPPRRNSSKADARKKYTAAVKHGADPADILAGAKLYADDRRGQDQQYTAHAATWLHQRRWEDALKQPPVEPDRPKAWWQA